VTVAEKWVASGAAVALVTLLPLAVALWSVCFGGRPKALEWAAIVLGAAGTLVMVMGEDLRARPVGTLLILIGVASWSLGTVLSRRIETPPGAMGFAAEMLAGGLMALVLSANPLVGLLVGWGLARAAGAANDGPAASSGDRASRDPLQVAQSRMGPVMGRAGVENVER